MTTCLEHPTYPHKHEADGPVFNGHEPHSYKLPCDECGDDVAVPLPRPRDPDTGEPAVVVCFWCRADAAASRAGLDSAYPE